MKLRPLGDHVVIQQLDAEEKTSGGILLPDTAKEKPTQGEVMAVGKGQTLSNGRVVEPTVKEGDRVLFGRYAGTEVKLGGDEFKIVSENDILCVVE
ncbi:MAG: co-chaperone GroES [Planctomycetota bacterium]|jgi:chaperonin GroES|nr:co-chaperone GroES [Planctomycetota bacterium]